MKKVLLLAPMASMQEKFNVANIEILKALGCEIHVATNFELSDYGEEYKQLLHKSEVHTHQISFVRASLLKNSRNIPIIRALFKAEQFNVVHCHTETGGILTRLSMGACKSTKYVYTPHGMSFYKGSSLKSQFIYRPLEKWICNKMSANLAMNSEEFSVLKAWNKDTAQMIHGIGVDIDKLQSVAIDTQAKRAEFNIPLDATLILSVGELNENKNHRVVIEALGKLADENLYYMICGEGAKRDELIALAAQYELQSKLILTGFRYDIDEILQIADIFVFPSFHEGLPVSLMEAMAMGLPIVCSNIRGNVDLIKNGEGGFLVESTDVDGFKDAISKIALSVEVQTRMKVKNLENIKEFSIEQVKRETKAIYEDVI